MAQQNENQQSSSAIVVKPVEKNGNGRNTDVINHPQNGIILMNGTILKCYPKEGQQQEEVSGAKDEHNAVDMTADRQLFVDNAFYLLSHRDRIMQDSRMFLAPVAVQSGVAYFGTGGFRCPTIGVYLEWWENCIGAMRTDENGRRSLVFQLAGSPLSGNNRCRELFEDGTTNFVTLLPFGLYFRPFINVNKRYKEAKLKYQAYTLREVLDILHQEDGDGVDYERNVKEYFMQHRIQELNERVMTLEKESSELYTKYQEALIKYNEMTLRNACLEYKSLKEKVNQETEDLKAQKSILKRELKQGQLDNIAYQRKVMPLNKRINELESNLRGMFYKMCNEFGELGIDMYTLEKCIERVENEDKC